MFKISFFRDKTYINGINLTLIAKLIKEGKNIDKYYNENETSIYVGLTVRGKYIKIRTNVKVIPKLWDAGKVQRVKRQHPLSLEINMRLTQLEASIEKELLLLSMKDPEYSVTEVKEIIFKIINGTNSKIAKDFWEVWAIYKEEQAKILKGSTIKKMQTFEKHLKAFQKKQHIISFSKIDLSFDVNFYFYLTNDLGLLNNSVTKLYATLKAFMKWSMIREYHQNTKFELFKHSWDKTDVLALTETELKCIEEVDLSYNKKLDKVRDIFLFSCYTGARYSDLQNLRIGDIQCDGNNTIWSLYQIKSNKTDKVTIPISKQAQQIVQKYLDKNLPVESYLLPVYSNQKMNAYIKEVCKQAGISSIIKKNRYSGKRRVDIMKPKYDFITMHTGRKTFVTLSLLRGMQSDIIRRITNHSDYRTMLIYADLNKQSVINEFNKFW